MDSLINIGLYIAYFALFIAVAALIFFPIATIVKGNFKNAKGTLVGIAVLVSVVILSYIISPADQGLFYTKMNVSAGESKLIGAGLITTYFIFAGLVLITLYTVVVKWFK
jgi:RsiW-degrading membrane proteinase PrsW (M82 family)